MNLDIRNWTWSEWTAFGRHGITAVGSVTATLVAVHFLSPQDAATVTDSLNSIWDGAVQISKGVAGLAGLGASIYAALNAKKSAEPASQIKAVVTNLSAPQIAQAANEVSDPEGRNKLIAAVSKMPEVRGIVMPESVASTIDSDKVVGTAAAVQQLPLATPRNAA